MKNNICNYFDYLYPNPKCFLNYNKDYELLIAIMLSAQTTDNKVNKVTPVLFSKYNSLLELKNASIYDLEEIVRPLGILKKAKYIKELSTILVDKYNSALPNSRELLELLPGVGRKTVSVFLSEYYGYPEFPVDTHIDRISKRLGIASINDNVIEVENKLKKFFPKNKWIRLHHQFISFGRDICNARNPKCNNCKLKEFCNYKNSSIK